ncbi:MAG: hypothetical protein KGI80_03485 [Verrucomicrobiota bacterium]|nr:hypothetical protein [Verrucomicrobiota bacterium]
MRNKQKGVTHSARSNRRSSSKQDAKYNREAEWETMRYLQHSMESAWKKFSTDIKNRASIEVLTEDRNKLLILLGECNYMIREYRNLQEGK